jgi:hypothetical protein
MSLSKLHIKSLPGPMKDEVIEKFRALFDEWLHYIYRSSDIVMTVT